MLLIAVAFSWQLCFYIGCASGEAGLLKECASVEAGLLKQLSFREAELLN